MRQNLIDSYKWLSKAQRPTNTI